MTSKLIVASSKPGRLCKYSDGSRTQQQKWISFTSLYNHVEEYGSTPVNVASGWASRSRTVATGVMRRIKHYKKEMSRILRIKRSFNELLDL